MTAITADHYFAGVIGVALLRHWYEDGEVNEALLADLAAVLDRRAEFPYSLRLDPREHDLGTGYADWAGTYDGPNPLIEGEEEVSRPLLERLVTPGSVALDAACGTGRHAAHLDTLGAVVVGVDRSPEMLAIARAKVPAARFEVGELERLPFAAATFDVAITSLALCHLADPTTAIAELARVLRPGGTLVITDPHPSSSLLGGQAFYGGISSRRPMTWVRNHYHHASTWLRAFRAAGLSVVDCLEPPMGEAQIASSPAASLFPDAARSAIAGLPSLWLWELRRAPSDDRSDDRSAEPTT